MNNEYELYHFGIKGMKWGIRRYRNPDGTLTPEGKRRYAEDGTRLSKKNREEKKDRKAASKNRRTLSEEDLRKKIQRLKLEKELKDLTEEDLSPGRKFVKDFMKPAGSKVLKTLAIGGSLWLVKEFFTRRGMEELGKYLAPRPKELKM